jgi:uncharacterized repeat protein (TIGR01451 family)
LSGQPIQYDLIVRNFGPANATNVVISDPTPPGLSFVSATAPCAAGFPCNAGNLAPGTQLILSVTYAVAPDIAGTDVQNTASVGATPPDPNGANNSSTVTLPIERLSDLSITKTDGTTTATPGNPISYTIVAHNAGPSAVTGANVVDTMPASITGAAWTCVGSGGGTCPVGGSGDINTSVDLPVGASATFTLTGIISASASGTLANTVTIAAPAGVIDPTPSDNSATDLPSRTIRPLPISSFCGTAGISRPSPLPRG